jgi:RNA polymerase sigma-70 factor (ECF subfamily)
MRAVTMTVDPDEQRLLEAARGGDADAFQQLIESQRAELHAHCYRMLGSLHDADDALQETRLRAWRGLSGFEAGRPLRPWLYRIATNVCLDALAKRSRRVLPIDQGPPANDRDRAGPPALETRWVEPYPDTVFGVDDGYAAPEARYERREAVELAFVAALQHLPARQRAVLILRDVLGFSAREVAAFLETTVASVNSALQRAHKTAKERLPARSQLATRRALGDDDLREVVDNYVAAWEKRDVHALVTMLVEDATFAMPPHPTWWHGREAVIRFIASTGTPDVRHIVTQANGQPAVAWYGWDRARNAYRPTALEVLGLDGPHVKDITAFVSPELYPRFGLPRELPRADPDQPGRRRRSMLR